MIVNESLVKLMNRAGGNIYDLPQEEDYILSKQKLAKETAQQSVRITRKGDDAQSIYIMHLADIIDRMETALHNQTIELIQAKRDLYANRSCINCRHNVSDGHTNTCSNPACSKETRTEYSWRGVIADE